MLDELNTLILFKEEDLHRQDDLVGKNCRSEKLQVPFKKKRKKELPVQQREEDDISQGI